MVPEPNNLMAKSHPILDEHLRFLDRSGRIPSRCILQVEVRQALVSVFLDADSFYERSGIYEWAAPKREMSCPSTRIVKRLDL